MSPRLQVPGEEPGSQPAEDPAATPAPQLTHDEMERERRQGLIAGAIGIVSISSSSSSTLTKVG